MQSNTFREFLNLGESEENTDPNVIAKSLTRTLGKKLAKLGYSQGSNGSGIVAMIDKEDGDYKKTVKLINDWLKVIGSDEQLKKGKLSGDMIVAYRGALLSVVETEDTFKITVS